MLVYVDTCVFRDYIERRNNKIIPIFTFTEDFFLKGLECEYSFMYSDWAEYQLKGLENNPIKIDLFENMRKNGKIKYVEVSEIDKTKARSYSTEYEDAVHACIAINNGASCIITRNVHHFGCFSDEILIRLPEHVEDAIRRVNK